MKNKEANETKSYPKQFWKFVGNKTKSKGKLNGQPGNLVTDDFEKAEVLNSHFVSVFTKENTPSIPTIQIVNGNIEIFDSINITSDKSIKQLNQLNIGKSPGPDETTHAA